MDIFATRTPANGWACFQSIRFTRNMALSRSRTRRGLIGCQSLNNMGSILTKVICSDVPRPGGHYEQAILHGKTKYVSGQLGVTKDTQNPENVSATEQVQFALGNIERIANTVGVGPCGCCEDHGLHHRNSTLGGSKQSICGLLRESQTSTFNRAMQRTTLGRENRDRSNRSALGVPSFRAHMPRPFFAHLARRYEPPSALDRR